MPLLTTGKPFIQALEQAGSLGVYAPLEGGYEGRYQRRLRATGYETMHISARGLGDLSAYLTGVHGKRPAHLGKKRNSYILYPAHARYASGSSATCYQRIGGMVDRRLGIIPSRTGILG